MTPKTQRIGILVIAIVLLVGTIGSFAMMVLASNNQQTEQDQQVKEYQDKLEKQQKETEQLSTRYSATFKKYKSKPASFDAGSVGDSVTYIDIKKGDGEAITDGFNDYRAFYIGWGPNGKVFDSSIDGDKLKAPLDLSQMTLIPGWYKGVKGMKIGGVRVITIPSDQAYGETGAGDDIPPNTPIKFLIMAIPPA